MTGRRFLSLLAFVGLTIGTAGCSALDRSPRSDALERGDAAFRSGDYGDAARAYERHLARVGAEEVDQAVHLRLAVIYLMLGTPETDPARGEAILERMIEAHPKGRLREVAETILALRARVEAERRRAVAGRDRSAALESRIEELERQLEALRRIDLESRRRPD